MDQFSSLANLLQTIHYGLSTFSEEETLMSPDLLNFAQDVSLETLLDEEEYDLFDDFTRLSLKEFHQKFEAFFEVAEPYYGKANYWLFLAKLPEWRELQSAAQQAELSLRYYLLNMGIIPGIHFVMSKEERNSLYQQLRDKKSDAQVD